MLIFFSPLFRYILGVESPLVCDILHTADENGIMKVTSKADFETAKTFSSDKKINEEKVVSEKEYIKFTLDDAITDPSKVKETHDVKLKEEIEHEKSGRKPLRKKIESINMPFYELVMKDGTLCDLNGLPRTTRVQYVCYPNGNHDIYSLKESSTCEYEVVVLSSLLCKKFIDFPLKN